MARGRNEALSTVIRELGWSQRQIANRFVRVAAEMGYDDLLGIGRSQVSMWILGTRPTGNAPAVLCETLSRGLRRPLTLHQIGLAPEEPTATQSNLWQVDTLTALAELGGGVYRRQFLNDAVYSVAGLALPPESWWQHSRDHARRRPAARGPITSRDVEAVHEATTLFQRLDQRYGGGYASTTATAFLNEEVIPALHRSAPSESLRRALFSAAGELVYVIGWAAFDANHHGLAQRYLQLAVKLAAEADEPALAGHILRALAHQALDLGHYHHAAELAVAAVDGPRYSAACPREKALLGVIHARSLAETGDPTGAAKALLRAEDDLAAASDTDEEPGRVWFFAQASLAHETARTLQAMGDTPHAEQQFHRSVHTRQTATFSRTHAVTLGYLGSVQAQRGEIEAACATWSQALHATPGIRSGRVRNTVVRMSRTLGACRRRGVAAAVDLEAHAAAVLRDLP